MIEDWGSYFWPTVRSSHGCDVSSVCLSCITYVLWLNHTS